MLVKETTQTNKKDLHYNKEFIFEASTGKDFHSIEGVMDSLYD